MHSKPSSEKILIIIYSLWKYNKTNSPFQKWAKDLNRHSSKEDYKQMANKHRKTCLPSLIMREIQIKTTVRYRLILIGISQFSHSVICQSLQLQGLQYVGLIRTATILHIYKEDIENLEPLCTVAVKWNQI